MAKSKSKSKIVDDEDAEIQEEELQTKSRSKASADEDVADEEAVDEETASPDEADAGAKKPPRRGVKAGITKTTMVFIFLNWLAVPAFLFFAYSDYVVRMQYSYRTILNYVAVWGLPLRSEEEYPSAENETRPRLLLNDDQLKEAFKARMRKSLTEKFVFVDEPVPLRLRPSDLKESETLKHDIFGTSKDTVDTLEDEITRVNTRLPGDIDAAAKEVFDKLKTDDEKREAVRKVLLPIAWNVQQVEKLDEKIKTANGADLNDLVKEAVQRRTYYDILAPINLFRPGDLASFEIEKIPDLNAFKIDQIKGFLTQRLNAFSAENYDKAAQLGEVWEKAMTGPDARKRDSIEKRKTIGFVLFTLGQVRIPTLDKYLYPKGIERAQTVSGLREFTSASVVYTRTVRTLDERKADAIKTDRRGYLLLANGEDMRTNGYIDQYNAHVDELVKIVQQIQLCQKRLAHLSTERDHLQKIFEQRVKQHAEVLDKLLAARKITEKNITDLRERQQQLHQALVELSDAADRNDRIYEQIRTIELNYLARTKKGASKAP